jgi:hypothetical protein
LVFDDVVEPKGVEEADPAPKTPPDCPEEPNGDEFDCPKGDDWPKGFEFKLDMEGAAVVPPNGDDPANEFPKGEFAVFG